MSTPTTEFVFLSAKSSLRPEDSSSTEGQAFLEVLAQKKALFGGLIWARGIDKPDVICIAVEILPSGSTFDLSLLSEFQSSPPKTLLVRAKSTDFVENPVTEIAILPLDEALTKDEIAAVSGYSTEFGKAMLTAPAPVAFSPGHMSLTYKSSWATGPPENRLVMMIGWRAVENHMDATKTMIFQDKLKPISDRMAGELDVTHFTFKMI